MKREFKFRGKNLQTNEWFYGNLLTFYPYLGAGDTIGQFTGLKDKNDKEIYEGDIVSTVLPFSDKEFRYRCEYDERTGAFKFYSLQSSFGGYLYWCDMGDVEIIGNIYDNPELLENK